MCAVIEIDDIWKPDLNAEAESVYKTTNQEHPGVKYLLNSINPYYIGGKILGIKLPEHYDFLSLRLTPGEIRSNFIKFGWRNVIAFQTRNPMHRAHEELCRMAYERLEADGILIHMLLGKLKKGKEGIVDKTSNLMTLRLLEFGREANKHASSRLTKKRTQRVIWLSSRT